MNQTVCCMVVVVSCDLSLHYLTAFLRLAYFETYSNATPTTAITMPRPHNHLTMPRPQDILYRYPPEGVEKLLHTRGLFLTLSDVMGSIGHDALSWYCGMQGLE